MRLQGETIYLEPITYNDTADVVRWRNSETVRSRFIYRGEFTEEGHVSWMKNMVETGKVVQFIIYDQATDKKVGSVYLRDIDKNNKKCEFGIFIGEDEFLGKHVGRQAARLITQYAFEELDMVKVFLRLLADNDRAHRSYEKAGFVQEGYFKNDVIIDGKPADVIFMAVYNKRYCNN